MAQEWEGKTYDSDWYEIDAMGNRLTGSKDWAANRADAQANDPQGAWNFSPEVKAANPVAWDQTAQGQAQLTDKNPTANWTPPGTTPAAPAAPPAAAPSPYDAAFGSSLSSKIGSDINLDPRVDTNDPAFRQAMDANALQTNLAADRSRAAMAQRRQATGTGTSGAVDTDVNKVLEQQALQDKTFEAGLMNQYRQQNLDRTKYAMGLGAGLLTSEQARALERELQGNQLAFGREGLAQQGKQFGEDLGLRRDTAGMNFALGQARLDQQAILALLGG